MSSTFLSRKEFKTLYGDRIYAIATNLEKLYRRQIRINEHVHFLRECKTNDIIPRGLQLKNTTAVFKNSQLLNRTEKQMRNNLLESRYKQNNLINIELNTQISILKWYLEDKHPERQHDNDIKWMNKHDDVPRIKLKEKHEKKISKLLHLQHQTQIRSKKDQQDTSNVVNISNTTLSNDHLQLLSIGMKFVPTPSYLNIIDIIANTEKSLYLMPAVIKQTAISEISTFVTKWKKPLKRNLSKEEHQLMKELKANENIIVVPADKGGKVVVMDRKEYIIKMEEKLNDRNLYKVVKDPTNVLKKKVSTLANRLFKENKITEMQKYEFSSIDNLPYVRGQPKIHKIGNPIRIVTCTRSTITSSMSQFTFGIIKQLRETVENCIMNTTELLKELSKIKLEDDDRLISLDVQDLFTNVQVEKAIELVLERIGYSENFCESTLSTNDLKELLQLCLMNNYFTFNGKFYRQINGLPMGNTLSPLLSDIFMHDYIKENMKHEEKEKLWRYVDDLLIITKMSEIELKKRVQELNAIDGPIKFTSEYENEKGQLNFLDTTLTRNIENQKIKVRWFRKTTASDRFLNYDSCHQQTIKKNIVKNMTRRIVDTTKDNQEQQEDLNELKLMLLKSNYPKKEVEKRIQETLRECNNSNPNQLPDLSSQKDDKMKYMLTLPYSPGIEILKRRLERLQIKLYFSYTKKITSSLPSNKNMQSRSVVYKIQCECGAEYVGETKVGLEKRMKQHETLIEKDNKEAHSEIIQHHHEKRWQCMFDPSRAVIIDVETDYKKRKIKETIYSNIINSINKHDKLDGAWKNIISKSSERIKERMRVKEHSK